MRSPLLNTGTDAVRDIAGNVLASSVSQQFAVAVPSLSTELFVGAASYVTDTTATLGTRENPYPTIGAAMTAAGAGDVVAVLPGVYAENVTMKQFVRLFSVSASSTDSSVFTTNTGDPLATVIRAPVHQQRTGIPTVSATNLQSFVGLETEIAGFTIASPLVGDPALGLHRPGRDRNRCHQLQYPDRQGLHRRRGRRDQCRHVGLRCPDAPDRERRHRREHRGCPDRRRRDDHVRVESGRFHQ